MKNSGPRRRQRRHNDGASKDARIDPYQPRTKIAGSALCPDCGAVYRRGMWRWEATPEGSAAHACPACRRTREGFPAGVVTLSGEFLREHHGEIFDLVHNVEKVRKSRHPLQRILATREQEGRLEVTTTDIHIARRLGDALLDAFQGEMHVSYSPGDYFVRVSWSR